MQVDLVIASVASASTAKTTPQSSTESGNGFGQILQWTQDAATAAVQPTQNAASAVVQGMQAAGPVLAASALPDSSASGPTGPSFPDFALAPPQIAATGLTSTAAPSTRTAPGTGVGGVDVPATKSPRTSRGDLHATWQSVGRVAEEPATALAFVPPVGAIPQAAPLPEPMPTPDSDGSAASYSMSVSSAVGRSGEPGSIDETTLAPNAFVDRRSEPARLASLAAASPNAASLPQTVSPDGSASPSLITPSAAGGTFKVDEDPQGPHVAEAFAGHRPASVPAGPDAPSTFVPQTVSPGGSASLGQISASPAAGSFRPGQEPQGFRVAEGSAQHRPALVSAASAAPPAFVPQTVSPGGSASPGQISASPTSGTFRTGQQPQRFGGAEAPAQNRPAPVIAMSDAPPAFVPQTASSSIQQQTVPSSGSASPDQISASPAAGSVRRGQEPQGFRVAEGSAQHRPAPVTAKPDGSQTFIPSFTGQQQALTGQPQAVLPDASGLPDSIGLPAASAPVKSGDGPQRLGFADGSRQDRSAFSVVGRPDTFEADLPLTGQQTVSPEAAASPTLINPSTVGGTFTLGEDPQSLRVTEGPAQNPPALITASSDLSPTAVLEATAPATGQRAVLPDAVASSDLPSLPAAEGRLKPGADLQRSRPAEDSAPNRSIPPLASRPDTSPASAPGSISPLTGQRTVATHAPAKPSESGSIRPQGATPDSGMMLRPHQIAVDPVQSGEQPVGQSAGQPSAAIEQVAPPIITPEVPAIAAAADTPQLHQHAPASPVEQVGPALVSLVKSTNGSQEMTVRLQPNELGKVQIRISRALSGITQIEIMAERPSTLLTLQRDQPQLHRASDEAGIPAAGRAVTFHAAPPTPTTSRDTSASSGGSGGQHGSAFQANGNADGDGSGGGRGNSARRPNGYSNRGRTTDLAGATAAKAATTSSLSNHIGLDITA